jgi:1-acyl-sn-glycerol-3-phosphate acyltransferase
MPVGVAGAAHASAWRLRLRAWTQRRVGHWLVVPFQLLVILLMRKIGRYSVPDAARLRRRYRELCGAPGPLIICANHLTFLDSALIIWAFGSCFWYLANPKRLSWNLPAGDFFRKKRLYRLVAFVSKCIFIHRDGSKAHKNAVLDVCRDLLASGETITIFPEGKRSRSGRFDAVNLTYGTAKMATLLGPDCRILCVYVRGNKQDEFSSYPPKGSRIFVDMELLPMPSAANRQSGGTPYHDLTSQIGQTLKAMEDRYFAGTGVPTR